MTEHELRLLEIQVNAMADLVEQLIRDAHADGHPERWPGRLNVLRAFIAARGLPPGTSLLDQSDKLAVVNAMAETIQCALERDDNPIREDG